MYTTSYWSQLVPKLVLSGVTFCSSKTVLIFFSNFDAFLREILISLRNKNYSWPKHDECRMNVIPLPGIKKLEGSGPGHPPPPLANLPPPSYTPSSTIHHLNKKSNGIMYGNSLFSYTLQWKLSDWENQYLGPMDQLFGLYGLFGLMTEANKPLWPL